MSIKINNKTIAGNYGSKPTSYRYVGEIFQSTIPIEDIKVACLDGHKIYSDEGYGSFIQHLISQSLLYPQLVCTEEVWQEKVTQYGSWGQFVINTQENSVRLPKLAGFVQGLNKLEDLASLLEAGLPNIEAEFQAIGQTGPSGAIYQKSAGNGSYPIDLQYRRNLVFDASYSNSIYGNSDTVQPQAIQYPYYIVLATGVVQAINVKEDVELNNPFVLLEPKYFENEIYNVSWLLANGTYNGSNAVHPSAYQALLVENNTEVAIGSTVTLPIGTEYTKRGLSVKLSTDSDITDYDFVVNTSDETFRLPTKVNLASGRAIVGNGERIGVNLGEQEGTLEGGAVVNTSDYQNYVTVKTENYAIENHLSIGLTTDPTKSNIETSDQELYLYFYVGETVQNANLVNVGRIEEKLSDKVDITNTEWATSACMPDYSTVITGLSNPFTAPTDGLISWNNDGTLNCTINGNIFYIGGNDTYNEGNVTLLLSKNDVISFTSDSSTPCFVSLKGVK